MTKTRNPPPDAMLARIELREPSALGSAHALIARYAPWITRAFTTLTSVWRGRVPDQPLTDRLAAADFEAANDIATRPMAETGPRALAELQRQLFGGEALELVHAGGADLASRVVPAELRRLLDLQLVRERAADYVRLNEPRLLREVTATTRGAVQGIIRRAVADRLESAEASRRIKQVIGLTESQSRAAYTFEQQLRERSTLGGMNPSDRRLSPLDRALVRRQMADGRLTGHQIETLVRRYRDSLIEKRANDIARTELFRALNAGQHRLVLDAANRGLVSRDGIKRVWTAVLDGRTRGSHAAAHRRYHAEPVGLDEPFVVEGVAHMTPPAGPNCRCVVEYQILNRFS